MSYTDTKPEYENGMILDELYEGIRFYVHCHYPKLSDYKLIVTENPGYRTRMVREHSAAGARVIVQAKRLTEVVERSWDFWPTPDDKSYDPR